MSENDANMDGWLGAVRLQPQIEQTFVKPANRRRGLIHRRIGDHDVVARNSAPGEKLDVMLWRERGIADRQGDHADVA
jgi:hypothetical protein